MMASASDSASASVDKREKMASADETVYPEKRLKLDDEWKEFDYDGNAGEDSEKEDHEVFSFDRSKFDEDYPEEYFPNPEERKEFLKYMERLKSSQGFYVESNGPTLLGVGGIFRMTKNMQSPGYVTAYKSAQFAIRTHNKKLQDERQKLEFIDIVRVNARCVTGYVFYITLLAKNINSGEQKTYQAKVYDNVLYRYRQLMFLRDEPQESIDAKYE